jgi:hypothetical protein
LFDSWPTVFCAATRAACFLRHELQVVDGHAALCGGSITNSRRASTGNWRCIVRRSRTAALRHRDTKARRCAGATP